LLGSSFTPLIKNTRWKILTGICGVLCLGLAGFMVSKTEFWTAKDPLTLSVGYVATFTAGLLGSALLLSSLLAPALNIKATRGDDSGAGTPKRTER